MSLDDGWKPVSMATGIGYWIDGWLMGWSNVDMAGSPSPGWAGMMSYPINWKSPKFTPNLG